MDFLNGATNKRKIFKSGLNARDSINMKKISLMFLTALVAVALLSGGVLAYIDPGTGGALFNIIWPLIVAVITAVMAFVTKWFWNPIKKTFSNIFKKSN